MGDRKQLWGYANGQEVYLITISNGALEVAISNFGCTIVSILMKTKSGRKENLVLGYSSLQDYVADPYYMGCIVGRFANRIGGASFTIDDVAYTLAANEASGNHLHGGIAGFNKKVFDIIEVTSNSIQLYYKSADEEEGYPGNLDVLVTYMLSSDNVLLIDYKATTDKATHVSLTNHSYFNLSAGGTSVLSHDLLINADNALVAGADYIPTGKIKPVTGTELDFREWKPVGNDSFKGYNECFCINPFEGAVVAALRDATSGRSMTVRTNLPGLMLYTGDYLSAPFYKNEGLCLETQFFPDSPNQPKFPGTLLLPGDVYHRQTLYQFFDYFLDQLPFA